MSFTEGKWEAKEETDLHVGIYPEDSADCLAIVWNTGNFDADDNAHLIAAAPELYRVCNEAFALCDAACKLSYKPEHDRIRKLCKAAICAAGGGKE